MGYIWKFDNVETQNKHEVSLGSCLFKMHLSFSKILAWTLEWVFIMVSFYSDVELSYHAWNCEMDTSLLITKKAMLLQNLPFYNAPRTWAIDNGSNSEPFTI